MLTESPECPLPKENHQTYPVMITASKIYVWEISWEAFPNMQSVCHMRDITSVLGTSKSGPSPNLLARRCYHAEASDRIVATTDDWILLSSDLKNVGGCAVLNITTFCLGHRLSHTLSTSLLSLCVPIQAASSGQCLLCV